MADLDPHGGRVALGPGIFISTPGLTGYAQILPPSRPGMRAAEVGTAALGRLLTAAGFEVMSAIEIRGATAELTAVPRANLRSTTAGEPALLLEVPDPGESWGQVVLATDEAGVCTWHFAAAQAGEPVTTRGTATRTYVVRSRVALAPSGRVGRGLIGAVGRKLLQVLAYRLLDDAVGQVADFFVSHWEAKHRPHGFRSFTPNDCTQEPTAAQPLDWGHLAAGRALLFLHGTFSRAHAAFGDLPGSAFAELHRRYEGRVFAFDHPTVSVGAVDNARELARLLPPDVGLNLDVVSHSRGGLVGRELSENHVAAELRGRLAIRRLVFVATPNAGTALTDPRHWGALLDTYTTILSFFPDNGLTDALEVLLAVVKQVGTGALKGLEGLQTMNPEGDYLLRRLNVLGAAVPTSYFAVAANFEPAEPGLKEYARDALLDHVFEQAANDLVVPTEGVYAGNGSPMFPIASPLVLPSAAGTWHCGYFSRPDVADRIMEWLK